MVYCRNCGAAMEDSAQFCSKCGTPNGLLKESNDRTNPNIINNDSIEDNNDEVKPKSSKTNPKSFTILAVILGLVFTVVAVFGGLILYNRLSKKHITLEDVCVYFENQGANIQSIESLKNSCETEQQFNKLISDFGHLATEYSDGLCIYIEDTEEYSKYGNALGIVDTINRETIFYYTESSEDWLIPRIRVQAFEFKSAENAKTAFDNMYFGSDIFRYANKRGETSNGTKNGVDYVVWIKEMEMPYECMQYECVYREGKYIIYIWGQDTNDSNTIINMIISLCDYFGLPAPSKILG